MEEKMIQKLAELVEEDHLFLQEPMKKHTTFRVGGPAEVYIKGTKEECQKVYRFCTEEKIPCMILGNCSNVLISDKGLKGVVLECGEKMSEICVEENLIQVEAGAHLAKIARIAYEHSLIGLEFAAGIPGSLGGAIVMNAGAYGGEIKDVLESVHVLTKEGELLELSGEELGLSYRHSVIPEKEWLVVDATLRLQKGNQVESKEKMDSYRQKRVASQPLEYPSAGSTFKRPEGHFAGKLIEDAGLKGYRIGGAMVAEKHAGFVINYDQASAKDIYDLIEYVKKTVMEQFQVQLEAEVKILGDF